MDKYLYKIDVEFESVKNHLDSVKELLGENIDNSNIGIVWHYHDMNIKQFYYSLFELELILRAFRDKLNEN